MRHTCLGTLVAGPVWMALREDSTALVTVDGYRCTSCGETLISAQAMRQLEHPPGPRGEDAE